MKLHLALCALSTVTLLAAGSSVMAANSTNGVAANDTGMATLGVDISGAGTTQDSVQAFNAKLSADQQAGVTAGCKKVMGDHGNATAANILAYCKNLGS